MCLFYKGDFGFIHSNILLKKYHQLIFNPVNSQDLTLLISHIFPISLPVASLSNS